MASASSCRSSHQYAASGGSGGPTKNSRGDPPGGESGRRRRGGCRGRRRRSAHRTRSRRRRARAASRTCAAGIPGALTEELEPLFEPPRRERGTARARDLPAARRPVVRQYEAGLRRRRARAASDTASRLDASDGDETAEVGSSRGAPGRSSSCAIRDEGDRGDAGTVFRMSIACGPKTGRKRITRGREAPVLHEVRCLSTIGPVVGIVARSVPAA